MTNPNLVPEGPRSWLSLFMASGGFMAVALSLFVIFATIMGSMALRQAVQFDQIGMWTTATIAETRIRRDDGTDYLARFEFSVGGIEVSAERNVGASYFRANPEGATVDIKYLPNQPQSFEFKEGSTQAVAKVAQKLALLLGIGALAAIWFPGYKAARGVLARRFDWIGTARVTDIVEVPKKRGPPSRGYMKFQDSEGRIGTSFCYPLPDLHTLGIGNQISVFVRSKEIWWEGDTGRRARVPSQLPKVPLPPSE
jgi:hypothetical protein